MPLIDLNTNRLRCNRQRPCQNCEVRGEVNACTYAKRVTGHGNISANSRRSELQDRIDRLEKLVRSAIGDKSGSSSPPRSSPDISASPEKSQAETRKPDSSLPAIGVLEIKDDQRSLYSGSTAWNPILHEVGAHDHFSNFLGCCPMHAVLIRWQRSTIYSRSGQRRSTSLNITMWNSPKAVASASHSL